MIFHENRLLADDSHEIYNTLLFSKILKDVAKFVVCCSHDWRFKGYSLKKARLGMGEIGYIQQPY